MSHLFDFKEFSEHVVTKIHGHVEGKDDKERTGQAVFLSCSDNDGVKEKSKINATEEDAVKKPSWVKERMTIADHGRLFKNDGSNDPDVGLDSTVVVDIDSKDQDEEDVEKSKAEVEKNNAGCAVEELSFGDIDGYCLQDKGGSDGVHAVVCVHRHVRVAELVDFHKAKRHHDVHHCGVELKTHIGRANVKTETEDSLEDHSDAHGKENAVLLWNSNLAEMVSGDTIGQGEEVRFESDEDDEDDSIPDITEVADEVVEVGEDPPGSGATVVEVTFLHAPSLLRSLLVMPHHLRGWDEVKETN